MTRVVSEYERQLICVSIPLRFAFRAAVDLELIDFVHKELCWLSARSTL
jgi:hypothetical protein